MKIHILSIAILFTIIVQNVEASTGCVDVTRAMVLSGKTPYKKLEIVKLKYGSRVDMVIKPMKSGDKVSLSVSRYSLDPDKNFKREDIINIERRPNELKISFFVDEQELKELSISLFNSVPWTTAPRFPYDGTMYDILDIQDFVHPARKGTSSGWWQVFLRWFACREFPQLPKAGGLHP